MYQKGEERREAILRATLRVIGAHGADAVTHRAVAAEAGVPLSATTYYFDSKEQLLQQSLLLAAREETERIERVVLDLAPRSLGVGEWAEAVSEVVGAEPARRGRDPGRAVRARARGHPDAGPAPGAGRLAVGAARRWPPWAAARWAPTSRSWTARWWWPRSRA